MWLFVRVYQSNTMLLVVVVVVQARWTCCDSSNPNSTYCFNTAYCDGCNRPSEPFAKFATFEVSTTDEERVLDGGERVLDVLASWQHSFDEDKVKNKKGGREVETFRFMFNKEGSVLGAASAFSSGKHTSYCQMHGKR